MQKELTKINPLGRVKATNIFVCEEGCKNSEIAITQIKYHFQDMNNIIWTQCKNLKCRRCNKDMIFSHGHLRNA